VVLATVAMEYCGDGGVDYDGAIKVSTTVVVMEVIVTMANMEVLL